MQKKWLIQPPIAAEAITALQDELKVDRIIASLLIQRNIGSFQAAQHFFRPSLEDLYDPFLLKDMDRAVARLHQAIHSNEKILLFGDYDVDGTTAVALLYAYLKPTYTNIDFYIPDRYSEGYGISFKGIDYANENGFSLIIALDCGIKSVGHVKYAKDLGIDFIICDHHTPGEVLPDAIVLDPKRKDCQYPFKGLSGCGVGFKLLQGYIQHYQLELDDLFQLLDLVAISIGADIVPIVDENRILCFHGLRLLNEQPRLAFQELLSLAKKSFPVSLTDVVFTIAPRINAAGRLRSGRQSVELMIANDLNMIQQLAEEINLDNTNRRSLDQEITQAAHEQILADATFHQKAVTVVYDENWHKGVVGIVASRLVEKHFKPTIVLTKSNNKITGSARTVNDFDIYEALVACEHLLEQFGGHTHAAGLTLAEDNLEEFIRTFNRVVQETILLDEALPNEQVDLEISLNEIYNPTEDRAKIPRLKRILNQFEPHGPGNMKPVFLSRNLYANDIRVLKDVHLKLQIGQMDSDIIIDAIAFNQAEALQLIEGGQLFDMIYTIESNVWNNRETLQLNIKDIQAQSSES